MIVIFQSLDKAIPRDIMRGMQVLTDSYQVRCPYCEVRTTHRYEGGINQFVCEQCLIPTWPRPLGCWNCEMRVPAWIDEMFCSKKCEKEYGQWR